MYEIIIVNKHWTNMEDAQKYASKLRKKGYATKVFANASDHWKVAYVKYERLE